MPKVGLGGRNVRGGKKLSQKKRRVNNNKREALRPTPTCSPPLSIQVGPVLFVCFGTTITVAGWTQASMDPTVFDCSLLFLSSSNSVIPSPNLHRP